MNNKMVTSIVAGLVAFAWSAISWMALPFHNQTLHKFQNESVVATTLQANAAYDGIYIIPLGNQHDPSLSKAEKKAAIKASEKKMKDGPFAFISILPNEKSFAMGPAMGIGLLKDIITAFLIIFILGFTKYLNFWQKTFFIVGMILAGTIVSILPLMIWWSFPTDFIVLTFIDVIIAWFLAGMVIAKLAK